MHMYLTAKPSGGRLQIPLLPDRLSVRTSAMTISAQIINLGEVKIPRGTSLTGYSWNGTFPGEHMRNYPFVTAWQQPRLIVNRIKEWMEKGQLLTLMLTEATINEDVFIESFTYEYQGKDTVTYSITLTAKRALTIKTVPPPPVPVKPPGKPPSTPNPAKVRTGHIVMSNPNERAPVLYEPKAGARAIDHYRHGLAVGIYERIGNYYPVLHNAGPLGYGYILERYVRLAPEASQGPGQYSPSRPNPSARPGTGHPDKNRIPDAAAGPSVHTVKPFETIADIARRTYGTNTAVQAIVNANKPLLQTVANTAKTIIGAVTAGLKLITPNAKPQVQPPKKGGGGSAGNNRPTMLVK